MSSASWVFDLLTELESWWAAGYEDVPDTVPHWATADLFDFAAQRSLSVHPLLVDGVELRHRCVLSDGSTGLEVSFQPSPRTAARAVAALVVSWDVELRALGHPGLATLMGDLVSGEDPPLTSRNLAAVLERWLDAYVQVGPLLSDFELCPQAEVLATLLVDGVDDVLEHDWYDPRTWASVLVHAGGALASSRALEPSAVRVDCSLLEILELEDVRRAAAGSVRDAIGARLPR